MKQFFSDSHYWGYLIVFFLTLAIPVGFLLFILFRNKKYMVYFSLAGLLPILAGAAASFIYYLSGDPHLRNVALSPLYLGLGLSVPIFIEALLGILLTSRIKKQDAL